MPTPSYNGMGQPIADNGGSWLGRLGSFFGASTPMYAGAGQPVIASTGLLGSTTPIYAVAPAPAQPSSKPSQSGDSQQVPVTASRGDCGCEPESDENEQALMTCPIDPEALASGCIAIVIPRQPVTDEQ
jgi:hypothetical protein